MELQINPQSKESYMGKVFSSTKDDATGAVKLNINLPNAIGVGIELLCEIRDLLLAIYVMEQQARGNGVATAVPRLYVPGSPQQP